MLFSTSNLNHQGGMGVHNKSLVLQNLPKFVKSAVSISVQVHSSQALEAVSTLFYSLFGSPDGPRPVSPGGHMPVSPAGHRPVSLAAHRPVSPAGPRPDSPAGLRLVSPADYRSVSPAGYKPVSPVGFQLICEADSL